MKRRIIGYMCAAVLLAGILYSPSLAAYAEAQVEPVKTEENLNEPEENGQNSFNQEAQEEELPVQQEEEDQARTEADILTAKTTHEEISVETGASEAIPASDGKKFYNLTFLTLQEGGEVIKTIQVEAGAICAEAEGFIPSKDVPKGYKGINYQWAMVGEKITIVGGTRPMPSEDLAVYVYRPTEAKNWVKEEKDGKIVWTYTASDSPIVIESDSHNWDQGIIIKEPACTEPGTKRYTCIDEGCGAIKEESISAKGHMEQSTGDKSATCTEDGYTGKTICSVCGVTVQEGTAESAMGHAYNDQNVCETCGAVQYEVIGSKSLTYTLKGTTGITLKVNSAQKDESKDGFKLQMDGQEVDAGSYTVSTEGWFWTIELKPAYLDTLSVSAHTITLRFANNKEETVNLIVNNAASGTTSGNTGEVGNNGNQGQGNSGSSSNKSSGNSSSTGAPVTVVNTGSPQTGDTSDMLLWAVLMLLSAFGAVFCIVKKNKAI